MKILITGGAGFIGSNFTRYMVKKYPNYNFTVFDKLSYAGNLENLKEIENYPNYKFIKGDVCDLNFLIHLLKDIDVVFHLAAESHVCNSVGNSLEFTKTNTFGTHTLLEAARLTNLKKFIHVSTDEVYGDILEGSFKEEDKLAPNNPYSASKAAAEMIVRSYQKTYNMPIIMTRGNNVYGPYQYPEKLISSLVCGLILKEKIPVHGKGENIRTFIYVDDCCEAIDTIFQKGQIGETYNIGTSDEISALNVLKLLIKKMGRDENCYHFVDDRPFNDIRYSVRTDKLKALGWQQKTSFDEGINKTINWYKNNPDWWMGLYNAHKSNYQNRYNN